VRSIEAALAVLVGSTLYAAVVIGWYIDVVQRTVEGKTEVSSPATLAFGSIGVFLLAAILTSKSVHLAAGGQ
jgi:hypothetical protein